MNTESVLPILCEWLVKSALIFSGAWLLLQGWRSATAAHRHLVWFLSLAAILLLPCTRLAAPRWAISLQPPKHAVVTLPVTTLPAVELIDTIPRAEIPPAPARIRTPLDWRKIILAAWLGGAALVLGYRLFGSWRLHRLYRRSTPADDPRVRLLLAGTASELGLCRRVEIRLSDECRVPITWGCLRPIMLLPRQAFTWSDTWLTAALRHEAAHILRYDYLTRWAAWIACAVYWPNPFIWFAARSLRIAQEQAADDLVLRSGTPPEEYAAQLVAVARSVATGGLFASQAVSMACPSTLEDRVVAIVAGHRDRRPLSRLAAIIGSSTALLILALCTVAQLQGADEKPAGAKDAKASGVFGPEIEISARFVELPSPWAPDAQNQIPIEGAPGASVPAEKLTIFSDPQFQLIVRTLNQRKGVNILASPRVITRSNQRAVIEMIREFRYPTEWEKDGGQWTPTQFETKNVGTTLEVQPRLKEDGTIELHTIASVVEFLGFIDLDDGKALPAARDALFNREGGGMPQAPLGHRYKTVFSERKREETVGLKSQQTALFPNLPETADVKPFEQNAPHGGLVVFLSSRLLAAAPERPSVPAASSTAEETKEAASRIVIPKFELREATLQEAVAALQQKITEVSGDKATIAIISNPSADADSARITVSLTQVPLLEAAKYVAELANQKLDFRSGAIVIGTPPPDAAAAGIGGAPAPPVESAARKKALEIVLPHFEIRDATLAEAIDALTRQSAAYDPEKTGIKIVLVPGKGPKSATVPIPEDARISINLTNIPLVEALRYVAGLANLEEVYTPTAVELRPAKPPVPRISGGPAGALPPVPASAAGLILKEWKIPSDLIPKGQSGQDWLTSKGIVFGDGAAATYTPDLGPPLSSRLVVRNTQEQLELIDVLIWRSISGTPATPANPGSDGTDKAQITSDKTSFENGVAIAKGNVHFVLGNYDVRADAIRYNPVSRQAELTGHATIKNGNNFIEGDDMTIVLKLNGGIDVSGPHQTHIVTPAAAAGGARPANEDVGDLFVQAYMTIQKSEQLERDGKITEALQLLQNAAEQLDELVKKYPDWQSQVVAYRKMRTAKAIERLQGTLSR